MPGYEYKVIPAPKKPSKIKGLRGTDQKFAASLAEIMNHFGRDGWEYQRTDTLPCEERQGLTGKTTVFQNMLIFRRAVIDEPVEMSVRTPTVAPQLAAPAAPAVAQIESYPDAEEDSAPVAQQADANDDTKDAEADMAAPVMPSFRSSVASNAAPALAAATYDAPEGKAPRIGAPGAAPAVPPPAPGVTAP